MRSIALLLCAVLAAPLAAQPEPNRPRLPRGADANDWEAYFDYGEDQVRRAPDASLAAFYWASRLDPTRAEPIFARWTAFFNRDPGSWWGYLTDDRRTVNRPEVIRNDSLLLRAYNRNPFVHRGLEVALYTSLGSRLRWDGAMMAFVSYGNGDFRQAADRFGRIVRSNPGRNVRFRHYRALSFVGAGELDSAAVEIEALLRVLREVEEERVVQHYESKAMYEYALGMLHEARGRPAAARAAFQRALVEDFSNVPARAALARMALRERRPEAAVEQLAQAVELAPGDGVMHHEHGVALAASRRWDEAAAALRQAIALEPHWAAPYLQLALVLDAAEEGEGAAAAYRMYLDRAPRRQAQEIARARERLALLGS